MLAQITMDTAIIAVFGVFVVVIGALLSRGINRIDVKLDAQDSKFGKLWSANNSRQSETAELRTDHEVLKRTVEDHLKSHDNGRNR